MQSLRTNKTIRWMKTGLMELSNENGMTQTKQRVEQGVFNKESNNKEYLHHSYFSSGQESHRQVSVTLHMN